MKKVIIAGGGVAGMSAAHELIDRGFEVHVYEKQPEYVGGKARSTNIPHTAKGNRKGLPGEHGFRFFPGFYKHVTDTMKRIPFEGNKKGVYDNLVATNRVLMGRESKNGIIGLVNFPKSLNDLKLIAKEMNVGDTGLSQKDIYIFMDKIWQLMTSCYERRLQEYERLAWWEFTGADYQSESYREFFVGGITRTLVAAKPRLVSTRTGGDILLQLIFQMANPFTHTDRVLNAPTNEAWLDPWRDHLIKQGVHYHHGVVLKEIHCEPGNENKDSKITGISVQEADGKVKTVKGDYYIMAVPVEAIAPLLNENILKADNQLSGILELANDVQWMTGMQFYLNQDVRITRGHMMIIDSPWAVTAISQPQFWDKVDLEKYGNGEVKGIISVDISDWNQIGYNGKAAKQCTKQEIMQEVWCQLNLGLRENGKSLLTADMVVFCNLDRDINYFPSTEKDEKLDLSLLKDCTDEVLKNWKGKYMATLIPGNSKDAFKTVDQEPLLVNNTRTWDLRPDAYCTIQNLFFASDYVRTHTDLATMEGANEAARRAVNVILERSGSSEKKCDIWNLHEPWLLAPLRWYDQRRFNKGMPWNENFPWFIKLVHWLFNLAGKISRHFVKK
ncbi:FAD-dependent oxidoreductase [Algoriphagus aestuarii]|nr:FAD-dependent oxidoreductase [Algoriphagus aestuarii]